MLVPSELCDLLHISTGSKVPHFIMSILPLSPIAPYFQIRVSLSSLENTPTFNEIEYRYQV